ncbi:MAG: hypothetical protein IIB77_07345 [Proteobacteria bacterium]|nr:hypothetical protein [Pseudomonadota bacterium]
MAINDRGSTRVDRVSNFSTNTSTFYHVVPFTHRLSLASAEKLYRLFGQKEQHQEK